MSGGVDDRWLDGWVGRGQGPGGSGTVQLVVTGGPDGEAVWQVRLQDGVIAEVTTGAADAAEVTLTLPAPVADAVADDTTTASATFMQGRMKTAGDLGLVLDVLAAVDARR